MPARIHRLAAYGMAVEVAAADRRVAAGEHAFLEALRVALRIAPIDAEQLVTAASTGHLAGYLDDRYLRIKNLIPIAAEVFALRALARGTATDEHRFQVRDFFVAIPDLALSTDELDSSCSARSAARARRTRRCSASCRASRAGCRIRWTATG